MTAYVLGLRSTAYSTSDTPDGNRAVRHTQDPVSQRPCDFLGSYARDGERRTVLLAPACPDGGEQGGHLIFRWPRAHVGDAIGFDGWDPLSQAFATLRAMIRPI